MANLEQRSDIICHSASVLRGDCRGVKAEVEKTIRGNLVIQARGDGGLDQGRYDRNRGIHTYIFLKFTRKKFKITKKLKE